MNLAEPKSAHLRRGGRAKVAIISVTEPDGRKEPNGPRNARTANPDTLVVPLRAHMRPAGTLIYWRARYGRRNIRLCRAAVTYEGMAPERDRQRAVLRDEVSATSTGAHLTSRAGVMLLSVMAANRDVRAQHDDSARGEGSSRVKGHEQTQCETCHIRSLRRRVDRGA